ncbi:glycoside hydrolase superfamily [Fomitopsis serialis]|uniref:glycoside hydrolase superfamily n=1 Tax=Fomitopsis serialis TaxID=139415 RepID=UPI002008EA2C|nr:glycoside hydrolase superfamily [Neoantrodia serialis]KAH9920959.1 glycoside hydrolase superfamily [Neoantrodia serialis]
MKLSSILFGLASALPIVAQDIYDIWSTTWQKDNLLTYKNLGSKHVSFGSPGSTGTSDIKIDDTTYHQSVVGFGAAMTDSSAKLLNDLKNSNSDKYWALLKYLFDPTDGADAAGFTYLRVPLGASDFSAKVYSFDDTSGDTSLNDFNIDAAPSYLFSVIKDVMSINGDLKVHVTPWSPPGWMKDGGSMNGGKFYTSLSDVFANYLLKSLQGFKSKGITPWAIGIQNEPQNSNNGYPTALIDAHWEGEIGQKLRSLMDDNGFKDTLLIGYEHNWDDAGAYPVDLMGQAADSFDGVAFHCYEGHVSQQETFHDAYPNKNIYFTECVGLFNGDWWGDVKAYLRNDVIGTVNNFARNAAFWNLVLDGSGGPKLPGTSSCGGKNQCRGVITLNSDGSYTRNPEFYALAQMSKGTIPKDKGGPSAQRIDASVGGNSNLLVSAFVTKRSSSSDQWRYSLVVLNQDDDSNGSWDPTAIDATIEFRGKQAKYTFPVGVTTLWWYAAPQ